jgi:Flp pilus assembly protein TadG
MHTSSRLFRLDRKLRRRCCDSHDGQQNLSTKRHRESGSTLVLVSMFMVVLFGFGALTIDVGRVYKEKRHMQFATDAGAYAGVARLTNATPSAAKADAILEATYLAGANGVTASEIASNQGVQVGIWVNGQFLADQTTNGYYTAVRVPALRNVDLTFAKVVGMSSMSPAVHSVAALTAAGLMVNPVPFGVTQGQMAGKGFGYFMDLNSTDVGSGKQGPLDLRNYQNPNAWKADMTTNGCNCEISVGDVPTISGIDSKVSSAIQNMGLGSIFAMPVIDNASFGGNSAQATIVGFVVVQLVNFSAQGNNWSATVMFLDRPSGSGGSGGSCPPPCTQARAIVQ